MLVSVLNYIIYTYFYKCKQKINLYYEKIGYESLQQKACIVYHKPTNKDDDR